MNKLLKCRLGDVAAYVNDKISSTDVALKSYVTTDSLLPLKAGRECAQNLPPTPCKLTSFKEGDVLVANIRPYLKKVWRADCSGGASADVLVLRAREGHYPKYLYAVLLQDSFYDYVMKAPNGSRMPRGDKRHIMDYELLSIPYEEERRIGDFLSSIDRKIGVCRGVCGVLEGMARELYEYWFVQFDFPDRQGRPYKASGGKMTWNSSLKRDIPQGWSSGTLSDIANVTMGQSPDGSSYNEEGIGSVFYQGCSDFGIRFPKPRLYTTEPKRFAKKGEILMSVRAPVGTLNIANSDCCIGRGLSALSSKHKSVTYLYYMLDDLRKAFDVQNTSGTTFGSITKDELLSLPAIVPANDAIEAFEKVSNPIFQKQMQLGEEIATLSRLRDELLPVLMNGQASLRL